MMTQRLLCCASNVSGYPMVYITCNVYRTLLYLTRYKTHALYISSATDRSLNYDD
jgi:hypothetical protein